MYAAKVMDTEPTYQPAMFRHYDGARRFMEANPIRTAGATIRGKWIDGRNFHYIERDGMRFCTDGKYH